MTDDEIISTWQRVCEFPAANGRLLTITREDALQVSRAMLAAEREACALMVMNYCKQTKNMEARGCLASVAYDIRSRT